MKTNDYLLWKEIDKINCDSYYYYRKNPYLNCFVCEKEIYKHDLYNNFILTFVKNNKLYKSDIFHLCLDCPTEKVYGQLILIENEDAIESYGAIYCDSCFFCNKKLDNEKKWYFYDHFNACLNCYHIDNFKSTYFKNRFVLTECKHEMIITDRCDDELIHLMPCIGRKIPDQIVNEVTIERMNDYLDKIEDICYIDDSVGYIFSPNATAIFTDWAEFPDDDACIALLTECDVKNDAMGGVLAMIADDHGRIGIFRLSSSFDQFINKMTFDSNLNIKNKYLNYAIQLCQKNNFQTYFG